MFTDEGIDKREIGDLGASNRTCILKLPTIDSIPVFSVALRSSDVT